MGLTVFPTHFRYICFVFNQTPMCYWVISFKRPLLNLLFMKLWLTFINLFPRFFSNIEILLISLKLLIATVKSLSN